MTQTVKLIVPGEQEVMAVNELPVFKTKDYDLQVFDERILGFFEALSKAIFADKAINRLPEMAALGFWLRRTNFNDIRSENQRLFTNSAYSPGPLGKVFHVCPANVDTMCIYSLSVSLLMGNRNILRVSDRMNAPQVKRLFAIMNSLVKTEEFRVFGEYINIITYSHNKETSNFLSERAQARVIWGGDNTIATFKGFKTNARTRDIIFADRISALCISCRAFLLLGEKELDLFAKNFFNDAYTFDQMGCSSPQAIFMLGNRADFADCRRKLLLVMEEYVPQHYDTDIASLASLKFNRMVDDCLDDRIKKTSGDNYFTLVEVVPQASTGILHSCGGGYFYINHIEQIAQLKDYVTAKLQTLSHFGVDGEDWAALKLLTRGEGIDRVVPMGKALDFHYIWDGYNLLDELSRKIYIKYK